MSISFSTVIGSAIQIEISRIQDKQNGISKGTSSLMSQYYIVKTIGTLIPSYFNGFLIQKFSYDIVFYLSALFSLIIFISGILLCEENVKNKINKSQSRIDFSPLIKKKDVSNNKILNLINNKNILILLLLIFILESSPTCASPLFYYETNILGLNPKDLGLIDFTSQIAIIIFIKIYDKFFYQFNFKSITFFVRILIFGSFSLIYLLITKSTQ
jgi:Na+/melibiose symporter-like transporter